MSQYLGNSKRQTAAIIRPATCPRFRSKNPADATSQSPFPLDLPLRAILLPPPLLSLRAQRSACITRAIVFAMGGMEILHLVWFSKTLHSHRNFPFLRLFSRFLRRVSEFNTNISFILHPPPPPPNHYP